MKENARRFRERVGIDVDTALLIEALMHSSFVNEQSSVGIRELESNERLEFLGDAVLDLYLAETLYTAYKLNEGDMSKTRALLANEDFLAEIARSLGIGDFIMLGKGEAASGGRNRDSILADAFEAIIAALYLDKGFSVVREFLDRLYSPHVSEVISSGIQRDFKTLLQEKSQVGGGPRPQYELIDTSGPPQRRRFRVRVVIGDRELGQGEGYSKKAAEQDAARQALEALSNSQEE
ncbi:MAG TPA: ribonuclease III [Kosmotogaceae bacterium]|nr:ribonuclease III [Kosmotogaceae bacterium]